MAFRALVAFFNMFSMQLLTLIPGFQAVAVVAQVAFCFYQACGLFGMTAYAGKFPVSAIACRMLVVHGFP